MLIEVLNEKNINYYKYKKWICEGYLYLKKIQGLQINKDTQDKIMKNINDLTNSKNTSGDILICLQNKNIIGYLWFIKNYNININSFEKYLYIHSVFVDPSCRRSGIGTLLFQKIENICKNENINEIYLDINVKDKKSQLFHTKIGFKEERILYKKNL